MSLLERRPVAKMTRPLPCLLLVALLVVVSALAAPKVRHSYIYNNTLLPIGVYPLKPSCHPITLSLCPHTRPYSMITLQPTILIGRNKIKSHTRAPLPQPSCQVLMQHPGTLTLLLSPHSPLTFTRTPILCLNLILQFIYVVVLVTGCTVTGLMVLDSRVRSLKTSARNCRSQLGN